MVAEGPLKETLSITSGYRVPCARWVTPPTRPAASSNTSMKTLPMIFLFRSGSVTPSRAPMKREDASTQTRSIPKCPRNVSSTDSLSPFRRSPVSTNIGVNLPGRASWSRAATTEESTPPESPRITLPSGPASALIISTASCLYAAMFQSGRMPHSEKRKFDRIWAPETVWATSGWNWTQ